MPPQLYNSKGDTIALAKKLGQGGEGAVLDVYDRGDLVAKLYHRMPTSEKAAKLAAMVALKTERLLKLSAWPVDTLHERPGGALKGFLMPKVTGHQDIHMLYGVKSRHAEYPEARWPFLIQAAANVARAFNVIHEHGHVVGDVNHGGVVVSKSATVRLVDCDSFQISANGSRYLCEVGVPTHTPPELQGRSFKGVVRTAEHDAFGLAVIIFQLLFMGRHPFSGAFLGRGDMPIEKAIREYRFAYGLGASSRQMKQPPGTLALEAASRQVGALFKRAFLPGVPRPRADEWLSPLGDLVRNIKQCTQNTGHSYLKTLTSCPWCEIESRSGILVFFPIHVAGVTIGTSAFNVTAIWAQITGIHPPGPIPALPIKASAGVTASTKAVQVKKVRVRRSVVTSIALAVVCAVLLAVSMGGGATFFLILIGGVAAILFARSADTTAAREFQLAKSEAERKWRDIEQRWRTQSDGQWFHSRLRELEAKKTQYQNLPGVRQRKLQQLEKEVYQRQLERFLDGYRIDKARISGIGHARQITLRSYGIETAADVMINAILSVPGFGPTYTAKLLAWRTSIEQRFVFDSRRGVDPLDRQAVEREIEVARTKLEQELRGGATELRRISDQTRSSREALRAAAETAIETFAQAEANVQAAKAIMTLAPVVAVLSVAVLITLLLKVDLSNLSSKRPVSISTPSSRPQENANLSSVLSPEQTAAQAKAAYDQGVVLTKARKFPEAESAYESAVTLKPDFADAHHELGYVRFKMNEFDDAIQALMRARSLRPKHAETLRVLGQIYEARESWPEAAKHYREAAILQPKHVATQYNLGRALKRIGDLDSAIQAMQDAVKLKPDWASAHYELGLIYLETGDREMALEEYTALTSLNQKLADQLYERIHE